MNSVNIDPVSAGTLQVRAALEGRDLTVSLLGSAEHGAKAVLDDFLAQVLASSTGCGSVTVDMRELEFMNSSSFKSFLTWMVKVQGLPEERRHKIRFVSNPKFHWQKRSLQSLASMGGGLVEIEEGKDAP